MSHHLIKIVLVSALTVGIFQIIAFEHYGRQMNTPFIVLPPQNRASRKRAPINGVFVMKVHRAEHATRTLCTLNRFFNSISKYPIRLFVDFEYANETLEALKTQANGADLEIIVDTVSWRQLPAEMNETERDEVLDNCKNFTTPEIAMCSKMNAALPYLYMGYWRYMKMADEPSLQRFDYFVSMDADAFLTRRIPDPFKIMADNNLTGIFNVDIHQRGMISKGVQEAAEAVFSLEERQNRFLDSPKYPFFNENGRWKRNGQGPPAFHGFFFGGRLDFFRQSRYRDYARRVVPYTYTYRTDEQGVMSVAWSLLADNVRIWFLPKHGYEMGVYHQGFVDQSQIVRVGLQQNKGEKPR